MAMANSEMTKAIPIVFVLADNGDCVKSQLETLEDLPKELANRIANVYTFCVAVLEMARVQTKTFLSRNLILYGNVESWNRANPKKYFVSRQMVSYKKTHLPLSLMQKPNQNSTIRDQEETEHRY